MAFEQLIFDPTAVDASNTELALIDPANGIDIRMQSWPHPDLNVLYASSQDTEGGLSVSSAIQNRQVSVTVRCFDVEPGDGKMLAAIKLLQQKVGKLQAEGGSIGRVLSNSTPAYWTVLRDVRLTVPVDYLFYGAKSAECELAFTLLPLGSQVELTLSDHVETSLPALVFTETAIPGAVSGLGRLLIDNDVAADQLWMRWGMRSRTYGTATTEALYYEAETRLPLGGAALAARSGASGGTVVRQGTLTTAWQSMFSFASSGTAYCSHVGDYGVMARVYDGGTAAAVNEMALEWSQGDLVNVTRNDPVSAAVVGDFSLVDLGQIHIAKALSDAQRWDGRIVATGAGTLDIDCVMLFPLEGSGQATAGSAIGASDTFLGRDDFNAYSSGAVLNARGAAIGGSWATSGATTDFAGTAAPFDPTGAGIAPGRVTSGDSGYRYAILGTGTPADVEVGVATYITATVPTDRAVIARWTDASNHLRLRLSITANVDGSRDSALVLETVVSGVATVIAQTPIGIGTAWPRADLKLIAFASGRVLGWILDHSGATLASINAVNSALGTGGALASGKSGFADRNASGETGARQYGNFYAAVPAQADAVAYANQSIELRSDRVRREDSTGVAWGNLDGRYAGQYLRVPHSGMEARPVEFIVKFSRGIPGMSADPAIDDLSAQLFVTPRVQAVPES